MEQFTVEVPGIYNGVGDQVVFLTGKTPDLAIVKGNASGRYFAVLAYGDRKNLLVNTTDPYQGTVIVPQKTMIVEVIAIGNWSIEVTAK